MSKLTTIDSAAEANRLFNSIQGTIVDIRHVRDFEKNHLPRAIHVDLMSNQFIAYFSEIDKNEKFLLYCSDGSRSKVAVRILMEMGFQQLYNLKNGIEELDEMS